MASPLTLFICLVVAVWCGKCAASTGEFVWFSDLHWDPEYGTPKAKKHLAGAPCQNADAPKFGAYGCGSPKALVESSIAEAALASGGNPDFILLTGDLLRHDKELAGLDAVSGFALSIPFSTVLAPAISCALCVGNCICVVPVCGSL